MKIPPPSMKRQLSEDEKREKSGQVTLTIDGIALSEDSDLNDIFALRCTPPSTQRSNARRQSKLKSPENTVL